MMESCFSGKPERDGPVEVDDIKKDLFEEFSALDAQECIQNNSENLQVYLRVRPLTAAESDSGESQDCVAIKGTNTVVLKPPRICQSNRQSDKSLPQTAQKFTFTQVFGPEASQRTVFEGSVQGLVKDVLHGGNCLVFTYGVTNAGKTFTFLGPDHDSGLLPRSLSLIFNSIEGRLYDRGDLKPQRCRDFSRLTPEQQAAEATGKRNLLRLLKENDKSLTSGRSTFLEGSSLSSNSSITEGDGFCVDVSGNIRFSVWVSFCEIYNENIHDLLEPVPSGNHKRTVLRLSQDVKGNSFIKDLRWIQVNSFEEAYRVMKIGRKNQSFSCTRLNQLSSRSHSIFSTRILRVEDAGVPRVLGISELSLCDLAGSERCSRTQNHGERLKEAGNINSSLLTLGKCISALRTNQNTKFQHHVPFRESKLTHFLQFFFCGAGRVSMVVNISQSSSYFDETLNVLKFSALAQKVVVLNTLPPVLDIDAGAHKPAMELSIIIDEADRRRNVAGRGRKSSLVAWETTLEDVLEDEDDEEEDNDEEDNDEEDEDTEMEGTVLEAAEEEEQKQSDSDAALRLVLEAQIREEVSAEFMELINKMEKDYSERLQKERELLEERADKRVEILKNLVCRTVELPAGGSKEQQVATLEGIISSMTEDLQRIREDAQNVHHHLSGHEQAAELEALRLEKQQSHDQLEALRLEKQQSHDQLEALRLEKQQSHDQLEALRLEKQQSHDQLEALRLEKQQSHDQLEALRLEKQQSHDQLEALRLEKQQSHDQLEALRLEKQQSHDQLEALRLEKQQSHDQLEALRLEKQQSHDQLEALRLEKQQSHDQLEALRLEKQQSHDQLEAAMRQEQLKVSELTAICRQKDLSIAELQESVENAARDSCQRSSKQEDWRKRQHDHQEDRGEPANKRVLLEEEIWRLQEENEQKEETINQLRLREETSRGLEEELRRREEELRKEQQLLEQKVQTLADLDACPNCDSVLSSLETEQKETSRLQKENKALVNGMFQLQTEVTSLQMKLQQQTDRSDSLSQQFRAAKSRLQELQSQLEQKSDSVRSLKQEVEQVDMHSSSTVFHTAMEELKKQSQEALQRSAHKTQLLEELQTQKDGLQREKEELQKEKEELQKEKEELQREKEELQKEKEELQREKEELQREKEELQKEKEELQKEKEELQTQKEELQTQKEGLQREKEELQTQKAALEERLANSLSSCSQLQEQLANQRQDFNLQLQSLRAELQSEGGALRGRLEEVERDQLTEVSELHQVVLEDSRQHVETLRGELQCLKEDLQRKMEEDKVNLENKENLEEKKTSLVEELKEEIQKLQERRMQDVKASPLRSNMADRRETPRTTCRKRKSNDVEDLVFSERKRNRVGGNTANNRQERRGEALQEVQSSRILNSKAKTTISLVEAVSTATKPRRGRKKLFKLGVSPMLDSPQMVSAEDEKESDHLIIRRRLRSKTCRK